MTQPEQRIALAEWMGWKTACGYKNSLLENCFYGSCPSQGLAWARCPDYPNDLNACHEVEMKLEGDDRIIYYYKLLELVTGKKSRDTTDFGFMCATSQQRTEALCRTLFPERFE